MLQVKQRISNLIHYKKGKLDLLIKISKQKDTAEYLNKILIINNHIIKLKELRKKCESNNVIFLKSLTNAEKNIYLDIIEGLNNYQISNKRYIEFNTVKKHVSNILSKTGCKNKTQLVLKALGDKYE